LHILNIKGIDCVEIAPIDVEAVWRGYRDETGVYALMRQVRDTHGASSGRRGLATWPAAARTPSRPVSGGGKGELTHV
jgi:hypothetical protein